MSCFCGGWTIPSNATASHTNAARFKAFPQAYARVTNIALSHGRFITDFDDEHRESYGHRRAASRRHSFGTGDAVGVQVELSGRPFEIIGCSEKRKNSFFGENEEDTAMFIPFRTGRKLSPRSTDLMMHIQAKTGQLPVALGQVEDILRGSEV